ncbi:Transglutaminase-like superfamily protein [Clostridium cavendishii DSM 21758]|uniref:Transglutaminase-like superfamily protein n=1 Tax=Clostridium cavendishii DSM 21758 TaxID=1121302 RepID=A0A1M6MP78_9CLOT|nr:transglutaminase domain-containing protein [Clostridium cavendishii]SHJ85257.1 Transglutaminase-like superfamily protein [Clostridium cavendishii DSM 21758]
MNFENNEVNKLLLNYICIILTLTIIKGCFSIQGFSYVINTIFFMFGIGIALFYDNKLKRLDRKLLFTMVILVCMLLATIMFRDTVVRSIWNNIINPIQKINDQLSKGLPTQISDYRTIFFIIIPIITAVYYSLIKNKLTDIILFLNYMLLLAYWYLNYKTEIKSLVIWVVLYSFIILALNTLMNINDNCKREGIRNSISNKKVYTLIVVTSILLTFIANTIPKDKVGKYGDYINNKCINEFVKDSKDVNNINSTKKQYSISYSGYSDSEKKLGGSVNINNKEAFRVNGLEPGMPVYFRGNVKTQYTGDRWLNRNFDFKSSVTSNQGFIERATAKGGVQRDITIYPDGVNTTSIFSPNYSIIAYQDSKEDEVFVDKDTNIFYSKIPIKRPYTVKYLDCNFIKENMKNIKFSKESDNSSYSLEMEENLYIPDTVTPATKKLAYEIVEGCNTNYEKAQKIKDYLTKNYKYTTSVNEVPEGRDFVDYFLFEEKKGYCVYFATAYTILNRIVSVPTRYVEGFKLSDISKERILEDGSMKVTNEDAHAWSEVLLVPDDKSNYFGYEKFWLEMDTSPTPYDEKLKNKEIIKENDKISGKEVFNNDINNKKEDKENKYENKPTDIKEGRTTKNYNLIFEILALVFLILIASVLVYLRNKKIEYILKTKSNKPLYIYSLKLMKKNKIIKSSNQTDMEFAKSIDDEELREKLVKLVDAVYKEAYGLEYNVYNKEEFYKYLKVYLKKKDGVIKYYLRKIINL